MHGYHAKCVSPTPDSTENFPTTREAKSLDRQART